MALQKLSPERLDTSAGIILTPASTPSATTIAGGATVETNIMFLRIGNT